MIPRNRQFAALISRFGEEVEILEQREGGTNVFNNPQSDWVSVDTTTCAVVKPDDTMKMNTVGGEKNIKTTNLFFPKDVSLPSKFRIKRKMTGEKFEVENVTPRRSHTEANAIEVS